VLHVDGVLKLGVSNSGVASGGLEELDVSMLS